VTDIRRDSDEAVLRVDADGQRVWFTLGYGAETPVQFDLAARTLADLARHPLSGRPAADIRTAGYGLGEQVRPKARSRSKCR
jgi:hypothetical protein